MNYQLVTLAVALSLAMASLPAFADTATLKTTVTTGESSAPPSPAPDKDSFGTRKGRHQDADRVECAAESPIGGKLPASGEVMVTPKQKQTAANEASTIVDHGPQPTIPATIYGRRTVALALGGGGARGAAHLGVLRVFEREHIPIDYIVGNSMGAIVGGMYASGLSIDKIKGCMDDGSMRHAYMPNSISSKSVMRRERRRSSPVAEALCRAVLGQKLHQVSR